MDVRRQRHLADPRRAISTAVQLDAERVAGRGPPEHGDAGAVGRRTGPRRARSRRAGRTSASQRRSAPSGFEQQHLGRAAGRPAQPQPGRDHLVSLTTTTSPGRSRSGRSATVRCSGGALPRSTSSRAASRGSIGTWAMRSAAARSRTPPAAPPPGYEPIGCVRRHLRRDDGRDEPVTIGDEGAMDDVGVDGPRRRHAARRCSLTRQEIFGVGAYIASSPSAWPAPATSSRTKPDVLVIASASASTPSPAM